MACTGYRCQVRLPASGTPQHLACRVYPPPTGRAATIYTTERAPADEVLSPSIPFIGTPEASFAQVAWQPL